MLKNLYLSTILALLGLVYTQNLFKQLKDDPSPADCLKVNPWLENIDLSKKPVIGILS